MNVTAGSAGRSRDMTSFGDWVLTISDAYDACRGSKFQTLRRRWQFCLFH